MEAVEEEKKSICTDHRIRYAHYCCEQAWSGNLQLIIAALRTTCVQ